MGLGDEIMASADAREAKENNPEAQVVFGKRGRARKWDKNQEIIFANNPYITKSEDSFSTILMALVRQFKEFMSLQEMAYGLNSIAAQILCEAAIRDAQNRELYPCPGDMNPENN